MYMTVSTILDAMLRRATEHAPAPPDGTLATDADLEKDGISLIYGITRASGAPDAPPRTRVHCPTNQHTERCQRTCGGCRG